MSPNDIFALAAKQTTGSWRQNFVSHATQYGYNPIELLFPQNRETSSGRPHMIQPDAEWVSAVMNGTSKVPFSRVRTTYIDITAEQARARGYTTTNQKFDVVYQLLRRETNPTTLYTRTKLDNDDYLDITDFDAIDFLREIQQTRWIEEAARAMLLGDGRLITDPYKIKEDCIRPIVSDVDLYSHKVQLAANMTTLDIMDEFVYARTHYKGSGSPTLFTTNAFLGNMLVERDTTNRRMHNGVAELANVLNVRNIVTVPHMDSLTRVDENDVVRNVIGIVVNMRDYTVGNTPNSKPRTFEQFDIDFNQHILLYEGRFSAALTMPKSALIFEQALA
jgi:hypothetical protein